MNNSYEKFVTKNIATDGKTNDICPIIDSNGDWKEVTGKDAIIMSITNLLMTPMGQYPFDPEYGSLLFKQLFEPMDEATYENIQYEIKDRIEMYEDRVTVDKVNVTFYKENKCAIVNVEFTIKDSRNKDKLSVTIENLVANMLTDAESTMPSIWN